MSPHPIRLLVVSYALSLAAAIIFAGVTWAAAFAFWIGGGALALALPLIPGLGAVFRRAAPEALPSDMAAALRRSQEAWDLDLEADSAGSASRNDGEVASRA